MLLYAARPGPLLPGCYGEVGSDDVGGVPVEGDGAVMASMIFDIRA
jgi:hypothetical protein